MVPSSNIATVEPLSEDVVHATSTGETARAGTYRLLALLLGDTPGKDVLDIVAGLPYSDTPIGKILANWRHVQRGLRQRQSHENITISL